MKYTITAAIKAESFTTEHGTFDKYMLQLKDESGAQTSCYINQKNSTPAPEPGSELNGSIEPDGRGGHKFKKEASFGGGASGARFNDPETRKEIIRQSSLAQAVAYVTKKSEYMEREDALKYLTGMEVLQVATYFAAYAEGRLHVKMTKQDIIDLLETEGSFEPVEAPKETKAEPAKPKKNFDQETVEVDPDDFDRFMAEKEG